MLSLLPSGHWSLSLFCVRWSSFILVFSWKIKNGDKKLLFNIFLVTGGKCLLSKNSKLYSCVFQSFDTGGHFDTCSIHFFFSSACTGNYFQLVLDKKKTLNLYNFAAIRCVRNRSFFLYQLKACSPIDPHRVTSGLFASSNPTHVVRQDPWGGDEPAEAI